jgi:hypothetical protein
VTHHLHDGNFHLFHASSCLAFQKTRHTVLKSLFCHLLAVNTAVPHVTAERVHVIPIYDRRAVN